MLAIYGHSVYAKSSLSERLGAGRNALGDEFHWLLLARLLISEGMQTCRVSCSKSGGYQRQRV